MIRYLSRGDVEGLGVTGHALADAIEQCVRAAALGRAENVPKSGVLLDDGRLFQSIMAVGHGSPAPPYGATKVIGLSPGNQAKGLGKGGKSQKEEHPIAVKHQVAQSH